MNNEINNINKIKTDNLDFTPPLIPEQNIQKYSPEPIKKKSIISIIFSTLGILLILAIFVVVIYYLLIFNKNGDKVFKNTINEIYNYVNVLYEKGKQFTNINYTNNIVSTIANLNIEKESNKDNKLLINFEYDLDYPNEKMVLASSIYNNNNEISNLIYNYEDANSYILLKKAYNKPILYDNNNLFKTKSNQEVTYDDYFYVFSKTKDYFLNSINKDDFDITLDIRKENNKYIFQKKVTYLIQNTIFDNIIEKVVDKIQNDEKYMQILYNILNKYYNYPNGYSMENVNDLIKKTKNDLIREYDGNIGINIYTDILGKNIKKIELSHEGNKLFYYDKTNIEININNYKFIYKNKTLNIYKNNTIVQTLNINSYNNNEINIEFLKNKYFNKLNIIINNNINIIYESNNINLNALIEKKDNNDYDYILNYEDGIDKYKLYGHININDNGKLTLFDKSNAIKKENLSYNDQMIIKEHYLSIKKQIDDFLNIQDKVNNNS